jgi:predicted dehydrogenase
MRGLPLKVGLIGLGKMGQNHLRVLAMLNSVQLAFIHDADPAVEARLSGLHGIPAARDLRSALSGVDAVVIATPTSTHAQYIERVAPQVRTLFVEKPLAGTLAESESIHRHAVEQGLRIQVGFIERFNSAVQVLKRVLEQSAEVVSIDFTRTNKLSARITDVDVVTDLMIHDVDLALYLNGPVREIFAQGARRDSMLGFASVMLTHANGRFSRIQASRISEKRTRTIQATCMDMFVDCDLLRKEVQLSRQSELRQKEDEPYVIDSRSESIEVRPQEALLLELQAFVSYARGEASAAVPTHVDGLEAMRICERIQTAVRA